MRKGINGCQPLSGINGDKPVAISRSAHRQESCHGILSPPLVRGRHSAHSVLPQTYHILVFFPEH